MKTKSINLFLYLGLIGFFTIGSSFFVDLYKVFYDEKDIYWTHQSMKLPIEDTSNNFQLFVSGKHLQNHLADKTLFTVDKGGVNYPVVSKDITVRLNNWDKVKSRILTKTVFTGFTFGIVLTLLIIGLAQTLNQRKRNGQ